MIYDIEHFLKNMHVQSDLKFDCCFLDKVGSLTIYLFIYYNLHKL